MTISVRQEISRDLTRHPGWPLFSQNAQAQTAPAVCVVTLLWDGPTATREELFRQSTTDLIEHVRALHRATDHSMLASFVHLTAQPKSATVLHRKIWKTYALAKAPASVQRGPEVLIDCGSYVRFTSWAAVTEADIPWLIEDAMQFEIAIPLLLPKHLIIREELALDWCGRALPPGGCASYADFSWPEFAISVAGMGGVCVRRTHADRQLTVDFFAADSLAERMAQVLTPVRDGH